MMVWNKKHIIPGVLAIDHTLNIIVHLYLALLLP